MKSSARILHVLSQRPSLTGSGIYLDAMVRLAAKTGFDQNAVIGIPAGNRNFSLGGLPPQAIHPVYFEADKESPMSPTAPPSDLKFPIPGMSDVMPYCSSVWSEMSEDQLQAYSHVWRRHLVRVIDQFKPHIIHSNHLWLVTSLLKDLAGEIPVVATCHATGLRQMALCPHLKEEVVTGCSKLDHFCVLHQNHRHEVMESLVVPSEKITITGVGFSDEIFHPGVTVSGDPTRSFNILYVGKYSHAKGLPWLLDAFASLQQKHPRIHLHIAGSGSGPEAETLHLRMKKMAPSLTMHGMLGQKELAQLMGRCAIAVLPSFYEGVPLVLAEAAACGCKIVATELPGVKEQLAPILGKTLYLVPMPRLVGIDTPRASDLPNFVQKITSTLEEALEDQSVSALDLRPLTWGNVFQKVETIWNQHLRKQD